MCHHFGRLVCPIIFLFRCGISRGPSKTHCSRLGGLPPLATWALGQAFAHCAWLGFAMPMWQHAWFVQSFSCFAVELQRCSGDMSGAPPSWVQRVSGLRLPMVTSVCPLRLAWLRDAHVAARSPQVALHQGRGGALVT